MDDLEKTITSWKKTVYDGIRENLSKYGVLAPAVVVLHKDGDIILSTPHSIDMRSHETAQMSVRATVRSYNPIAYMAFGEAKIHITKKGETNEELYKSVNYDLSKLKDSKDSVIVVEETLFTSDVFVYEVIKEDSSAIMSPEPISDLDGGSQFDVFAGGLKII